ncbi:putative reverse transcriptase domain-containing protein, partial [Tanacetum coccineum]
TIPNTRSGASRTREGINEQIDHQMAEALGARNAAKNLEPLIRDTGGQEEGNGGNGKGGNGNGGNGNEVNRNGVNGNRGNGNGRNGNGVNGNRGNGNGNRNGGGNGYNFGGFMPARECTYQDFMKCRPLSFNGTKGVVGLTRWFEKMEMVFHISNYPDKYQVKYATCTLLNSVLTWWNSHKRTIRIEAAYAMSWAELMKLMTEVYCPRNEELVLLYTRMVPNEEDKVERFVGGLPVNIQGNGYARSAENKNNPRENHGHQPVFKRQNVGGQNMTRAYMAGNNEKRVTSNTQRDPVGNQPGIVCYECGRPRHFRKDCPKLRNQNRGNKTGNKTRNKTGNKTGNKTRNKTRNQTGSNKATTKAYAIG